VQLKRKRVGKTFLWLGIAAWFPYGVANYGLGHDLEAWPFLTWHLVGVVPGSLMLRWQRVRALGGKIVVRCRGVRDQGSGMRDEG